MRQLAALPGWLLAALEPAQVADALALHVPEFISGELKLRSCKVKRLILKDTSGRWAGTYNVTYEGPAAQKQTLALRGMLTAPNVVRRSPPAADQQPFGTDGWRVYLPELRLDLEVEPPETTLVAMPQLIDPEQSRALLEQRISASAPVYRDMQVISCTPEIISYKPGSRCTIRYRLEYSTEQADRGWPTAVIAKTYRKNSKGQNAYGGMLALWNSALAAGDIVTIAEPLAYVPELTLLVQGIIPAEQSLEDLLKSALIAGTPEALGELDHVMRMAARGLAALHQSGARCGETITYEQRLPDIHELLQRLAVPAPELAGAVAPLLVRLAALADAYPTDATVPTHGTFDPEQVLILAG
jgi:hypothetical protein